MALEHYIWQNNEYNVLNLPTQISFEGGKRIINIYAADGRKLEAIYLTKITENIDAIEVTLGNTNDISEINGKHYIGNFEYEYSVLEDRFAPQLTKVFNAEGYVEEGNWYYFRKDHLGNNREVAVVNGTAMQTVQTNNYYPSGLLWSDGKVLTIDNGQPYKYNGKEYIEDFGYDCFAYGFRDYYATIGRFTSIDPLAEESYYQSPYSYASNNFIGEIDWMGLSAITSLRMQNDNISVGNGRFGGGGGGFGGLLGKDWDKIGDFNLSWESFNEMLERLFGNEQGILGGIIGNGGLIGALNYTEINDDGIIIYHSAYNRNGELDNGIYQNGERIGTEIDGQMYWMFTNIDDWNYYDKDGNWNAATLSVVVCVGEKKILQNNISQEQYRAFLMPESTEPIAIGLRAGYEAGYNGKNKNLWMSWIQAIFTPENAAMAVGYNMGYERGKEDKKKGWPSRLY